MFIRWFQFQFHSVCIMSATNNIVANTSDDVDDGELGGSELGTHAYWEKSYSREIANYRTHGDVGEVWFDEDSQLRVINWMLRRSDSISTDAAIIDLGCGNGMMLIELAREGYTNLTGTDYSPLAIELAQSIARDQNINISYRVGDLLSDTFVADFGQFDVVHDKGTYDAISLHPDEPKEKRQRYIENVHRLMADTADAVLILTSCNWTEPELCAAFAGRFEKLAVIPAPSFMFGGKVGSVVTSLVFRKV